MLAAMKIRLSRPSARNSGRASCAGMVVTAAAASFVLAAALTPRASLAQAGASPEIQALLNQVERLQRDMNTLQRQVYRGGVPTAASASDGATSAPPLAAEPNLAAAMQVRLDEIETQMRSFTGRLEETNHAITELNRKLDTLASDIEVRFRTAGPAAAGAAPGAAGQPGAPAEPPAAAAAPTTRGVLGTIPLGDVEKGDPAAARSGAATQQAAIVLPKGSAQDQYRYATSFLAKSDWAGAEKALKAFLAAHPKGELAGNAQYWLGESHYVRGDYNNAALAFAKGYKDFPKSAKGPDNLLKLGLSLANLKKTDSACATFERMSKDFPSAPQSIKSRVAAERKKLRCK